MTPNPTPSLIYGSNNNIVLHRPPPSSSFEVVAAAFANPEPLPQLLVRMAMPAPFHAALTLLFQGMALEGYTPLEWTTSRTCLIYKKGDPTLLDN